VTPQAAAARLRPLWARYESLEEADGPTITRLLLEVRAIVRDVDVAGPDEGNEVLLMSALAAVADFKAVGALELLATAWPLRGAEAEAVQQRADIAVGEAMATVGALVGFAAGPQPTH
jgi:hypothetical protein